MTSDDEDSDEDKGAKETSEEDAYHPDNMTSSVQRTNGLRPRNPRDYSHIHTYVVHHAMTQYSLKSGLKKFQKKVKKLSRKKCYRYICVILSNHKMQKN
jgi:hypothetical protein